MRFHFLPLTCITAALAACNASSSPKSTGTTTYEPSVPQHATVEPPNVPPTTAEGTYAATPTAAGSYAESTAAGAYTGTPPTETTNPTEESSDYRSSPTGVTQTTGAMVEVNRDVPSAGIPSQSLKGKTVAILATDGVEQVELTDPRHALDAAGAKTVLIAPKGGTIQGMNHTEKGAQLRVDMTLAEADPAQFSALLLPGGVANPDALRQDPKAVAFVKTFVTAHKPIAAICHGPWTLIEAGGVRGKTLTSYPSLRTDLTNAGAKWTDQPMVDDHGLVTSRNPDDLPEFTRQAIAEFAKP